MSNTVGLDLRMFRDLSKQAQERAYQSYYAAMDDDINRDSIVSIEEYAELAEQEGLLFNKRSRARPVSRLKSPSESTE